LTGAKVEGSTIFEVVPVEGVMPETQEAAGAATEPAEITSGGAPGVAVEVRDDVLPESSLEVVVRSPEIQDAEPIRSAPMSEAPVDVVAGGLAANCTDEQYTELLEQMAPIAEQVAEKLNLQ
jgi:hypothetical protein